MDKELIDTVQKGFEMLSASGGAISAAIAAVGAGLSTMGGAVGVGLVASKYLEAIARQPEELKTLRTNMFIVVALAEALGFFGAIVALLVIFK